MTKLELMMNNNELEARVIELEVELKVKDDVIAELKTAHEDALTANAYARSALWNLEQEIEEAAAERPALAYELWYAMLHEKPGSNPSLSALAATAGTRIIA